MAFISEYVGLETFITGAHPSLCVWGGRGGGGAAMVMPLLTIIAFAYLGAFSVRYIRVSG